MQEAEGSESLASDSGGFTVRNTNDFARGIERIANESRSYYLIGYTPTDQRRDGRFRKISVKLTRAKGLQVRARKGYYAPLDASLAATTVKPPVGDPDVQAALDSPYDAKEIPLRMTSYVFGETLLGKASVLVATEVDLKPFQFKEEDGRFVDAIEFLLIAAHRESGEFFRYDQKVDMRLQAETRDKLYRTWYPIVRDFELAPGGYQAKIVVRDKNSGRIGTVVHEFEVPALTQFRVSTPVLSDALREDADPKAPRPGGDGAALLRRRRHGVRAVRGVRRRARQAHGDAAGHRGLRDPRARTGRWRSRSTRRGSRPLRWGGCPASSGSPLGATPPGSYEMVLTLVDEVAGKTLEIREPFTVEPAAAATAANCGGASARVLEYLGVQLPSPIVNERSSPWMARRPDSQGRFSCPETPNRSASQPKRVLNPWPSREGSARFTVPFLARLAGGVADHLLGAQTRDDGRVEHHRLLGVAFEHQVVATWVGGMADRKISAAGVTINVDTFRNGDSSWDESSPGDSVWTDLHDVTARRRREAPPAGPLFPPAAHGPARTPRAGWAPGHLRSAPERRPCRGSAAERPRTAARWGGRRGGGGTQAGKSSTPAMASKKGRACSRVFRVTRRRSSPSSAGVASGLTPALTPVGVRGREIEGPVHEVEGGGLRGAMPLDRAAAVDVRREVEREPPDRAIARALQGLQLDDLADGSDTAAHEAQRGDRLESLGAERGAECRGDGSFEFRFRDRRRPAVDGFGAPAYVFEDAVPVAHDLGLAAERYCPGEAGAAGVVAAGAAGTEAREPRGRIPPARRRARPKPPARRPHRAPPCRGSTPRAGAASTGPGWSP